MWSQQPWGPKEPGLPLPCAALEQDSGCAFSSNRRNGSDGDAVYVLAPQAVLGPRVMRPVLHRTNGHWVSNPQEPGIQGLGCLNVHPLKFYHQNLLPHLYFKHGICA